MWRMVNSSLVKISYNLMRIVKDSINIMVLVNLEELNWFTKASKVWSKHLYRDF